MDDRLYNVKIDCPVCSKRIEVTKVKAKACKVVSRDSDFCVYYEDVNPIFYDMWVCEFCGYAAQAEKFGKLNSKDSKTILENITPRWKKRSFLGERDADSAIEAFKLGLYSLQTIKAKLSDIARVCLRIAWLYRFKNDEKEKDFLKFALSCYSAAFEKERFPIEKLDETTCMYIIAELNRRVGNLNESVKWFGRIISSPEARKNQKLMENTRDQIQLAKEQIAKSENTIA